MCLSIGQLRTIKTHYLTNTSHLVASIKHIFDYNVQRVKVIRICEEGYHLFIILSPAIMSQKKRAWFEKNRSMHNISSDLLEEDPNIGITDDLITSIYQPRIMLTTYCGLGVRFVKNIGLATRLSARTFCSTIERFVT